MIAVDTNVLVGVIQTFDPEVRTTGRRAVKSLYRQGERLVCFPQNLVEFWNASTRPANANGLDFTREQAVRRWIDSTFGRASGPSCGHRRCYVRGVFVHDGAIPSLAVGGQARRPVLRFPDFYAAIRRHDSYRC